MMRRRTCVAVLGLLVLLPAPLLVAKFGAASLPNSARVAASVVPGPSARSAVVEGVVKSYLGQPLAGAVVRASELASSALSVQHGARRTTQTDAKGAFRIELPVGNFLLEASAAGYANQAHRHEGGNAVRRFEFLLSPGGRLSGRVRRDTDGGGVAAVTVIAERVPSTTSAQRDARIATALTDAEGHFRIDGVGPGALRLRAESPEFATAESTVTTLSPGQAQELELWAQPSFRVSGAIVEQGSRRPLAGAIVRAVALGSQRSRQSPGTTDARGVFQIIGLQPGRYAFDVEAEGWLPRRVLGDPVLVADSHVSALELSVDPGYRVRGSVDPRWETALVLTRRVEAIDEGAAALSRGELALQVAAGRGSFEFAHVPTGEFMLTGRAANGRIARRIVRVDGRDQSAVDLALERRASISGRVLDSSGIAQSQAWVQVAAKASSEELDASASVAEVALNENVMRHVPTDSNGRFKADDLPPGEYSISVYDSWRRLQWGNAEDEEAAAKPILMRVSGSNTTVGVVLTTATCRARVTGKIVDASERPTAGVWVGVRQLNLQAKRGDEPVPLEPFDHGVERSTIAGSDGTFSVTGLCPGTYEVRARSHSGDFAGMRLAATSAGPVDVQLQPTTGVQGVVQQGGAPIRHYVIAVTGPQLIRKEIHSASGAYQLEKLDPGEYEVMVLAEDGYVMSRLSAAPHDSGARDLELIPWASLRGQLLGAGATPLAGVEIEALAQPRVTGNRTESAERAELRVRRTTSDASGHFEMQGLVAGKTQLSFRRGAARWLVADTRFEGTGPGITGPGPWLTVDLRPGQKAELGGIALHGAPRR